MNYPSDMNQNDFDRAMNNLDSDDLKEGIDNSTFNDNYDLPGYDENPPQKTYLLDCGHFGPLTGCQKCFDEYDELCKEAIAEWEENHKNE